MSLKQMQALDANKEALAQPEQEQFALKHRIAELEGAVIGLQTQRTWVGLTDEQARVKFEAWHKSTYTQPLERYGHTYKNMHVRNRWQGWLAAQGIERGV